MTCHRSGIFGGWGHASDMFKTGLKKCCHDIQVLYWVLNCILNCILVYASCSENWSRHTTWNLCGHFSTEHCNWPREIPYQVQSGKACFPYTYMSSHSKASLRGWAGLTGLKFSSSQAGTNQAKEPRSFNGFHHPYRKWQRSPKTMMSHTLKIHISWR